MEQVDRLKDTPRKKKRKEREGGMKERQRVRDREKRGVRALLFANRRYSIEKKENIGRVSFGNVFVGYLLFICE